MCQCRLVDDYWLWVYYQQALQNRKQNKAQKISQALGFIRNSYLNTRSISATQSLQAQDWFRNDPILDQVAIIKGHLSDVQQSTATYVVWHLHSPKQQILYMHLTHSHAIKAWLNREVLPQLSHPETWQIDQSTWAVNMRKGYNRLMIHLPDPQAQLLLRVSDTQGRILNDQMLRTHHAQWGPSPEAVEALNPKPPQSRWQKVMKVLNKTPKALSDDELLGLAHYAHIYNLSDQDRVWLTIELDRRWNLKANWNLAEAFSALVPARLRQQMWSNYNLLGIVPKNIEDEWRYQHLLLQRTEDAMVDVRLKEATQDLELLVRSPLPNLKVIQIWAHWFAMLDLSYLSMTLLSYIHKYWPTHPIYNLTYTQSLWQQGHHAEAICTLLDTLSTHTHYKPPSPLLKSPQKSKSHAFIQSYMMNDSWALLWRSLREEIKQKNDLLYTHIHSLCKYKRSHIQQVDQAMDTWLTQGALGLAYWVDDVMTAIRIQSEGMFTSSMKKSLDAPILKKLLKEKWLTNQRSQNQRSQNQRSQNKTSSDSSSTEHPTSALLGDSMDTFLSTNYLSLWQTFNQTSHQVPNHIKQDDHSSHILARYIHIDFDPQGRLTRRQRNIVAIVHPHQAQHWQTVSVLYQPQHQNLTIEAAHIYRKVGRKWVKYLAHSQKEQSISEHNYRLYYDVQKKSITLDALQAGDLIEWAWNIKQKDDDIQSIIPYAEMIPLQSKDPIHHLQISLGKQAQQRLHQQVMLISK